MTHDAAPHGARIFQTACSTNIPPLTGLGLVNRRRGGDVSSPYHPPKRKIHPFNFPLCVFASLREIPARTRSCPTPNPVVRKRFRITRRREDAKMKAERGQEPER